MWKNSLFLLNRLTGSLLGSICAYNLIVMNKGNALKVQKNSKHVGMHYFGIKIFPVFNVAYKVSGSVKFVFHTCQTRNNVIGAY